MPGWTPARTSRCWRPASSSTPSKGGARGFKVWHRRRKGLAPAGSMTTACAGWPELLAKARLRAKPAPALGIGRAWRYQACAIPHAADHAGTPRRRARRVHEVPNRHRWHEAIGPRLEFVQENQSRSHRGVLRGLHWQQAHPQAKLVRVTRGEVRRGGGPALRRPPSAAGSGIACRTRPSTGVPAGGLVTGSWCSRIWPTVVLCEHTAALLSRATTTPSPGNRSGGAYDRLAAGRSSPAPSRPAMP